MVLCPAQRRLFPGICLAQEGRSQRHFRASSGGQEQRACVGEKEAFCCHHSLGTAPFSLLDRWLPLIC